MARLRKFGAKPAVLEHYQQILNLLKSADIMDVMQGVSQLSSELVMAQDDVLAAFPLDLLTPPLVDCLLKEGIEDVGLYAINCLNQLAEALPNVCGIIAACGGVPAVCSKLMNLSYIDVSEQAIKLLEKLAYEHAPLILQEGGLGTLLNVMDFFEAATQKQVLSIMVNLARGVQSQEIFIQQVAPALPLVATFLQYRSKESMQTNEKALDFYISLVSSLERLNRGSHESLKTNLELIHEQGVVQNAMELAQLARPLLPQVFRLLAGMCRGSAKILGEWLQMGGGELLGATLAADNEEDNPKLGAYVVDALQLVDNILPRVNSRESEIGTLYRTHPALLTNLGETLIPKLFILYERFLNGTVRQLTLDILEKLLAHEHFLQTISPSHAASFLAELLCSKDITTVKKALSIAKVLYEKVPEQVARYFVKEGVIFRIESLRKADLRMDPAALSPFLRESSSRSRLRMLLEGMDSTMEPRLLDQFLRHMRRRGLEDEDFDMPLSDRLRRSASERTDPVADMRAEIESLSSEVLACSQRLSKEPYSRTLNELKSVSNRLFASSSDDPEPHLSQLLQLLSGPEGVSAFEFSASGICATLWRWLTCAQEFNEATAPMKRISSAAIRLREFLKSVLKERGDGKTHFHRLVELLGEVVAHDQQLPLTLYESPMGGSSLIMGLRTLSQRVQLQLNYTPDPLTPDMPADLRTDFETKNVLFGSIGSLSIALEQFQSLETISDLLSKVKATEDLEMFKTTSYRSGTRVRGINQGQMSLIRQHVRLQQMMSDNFDLRTSLSELGLISDGNEELLAELQDQLSRDPEEDEALESAELSEETEAELIQPQRKVSYYPSDLVAKLYVNNTEIASKATVFEIVNKFMGPLSDEPLSLQFKFVKKEETDASEFSRFMYGPQAALWQLMKEAANVGVDANDPLHCPLRLLKLFSALNRLLPGLFSRGSLYFPGSEDPTIKLPLPAQTFQSSKLTALLSKQTQDVVAVLGHTVSEWVWKLPLKCSFAFVFPARVNLFRVGGVSPVKALQYCAGKLKASGDLLQIRTQRHKVRVDREHVLDTAMKTLSDRALLQQSTLEFDYPNEEGTGAGPTLEFYSLTAREIRKLAVWRNTGEETGLFPSPIASADSAEMFEFIGRFVGKAISEEKVIDLPISTAFWRLVFGANLTIGDLQYVDRGLHRHLADLAEVAGRRNWILANTAFSPEMKERQLGQLNFKGTSIADMALTFVVPGYDLALKDRGKDVYVTLESLDEYIHLVAEKTLLQVQQASAFRRGLELSVSVRALSGFSGEELETIVCGEDGGKWDEETLREAVIPAHGYTKSSSVFRHLLQVMSELSPQDKKLCLQFLTGSPRLPIGGFKALNPPLTVVRKTTNGPADSFLPSVMTCQNYLKLPDYTSLEALRKNFKYAFTEAHDTFHLS